jgi:drug/metabolite transporter (DMT)-like permease
MPALYLLGVAACAAGGTLWGQRRPLRRLAGAALAVAGVLIIYVALRGR